MTFPDIAILSDFERSFTKMIFSPPVAINNKTRNTSNRELFFQSLENLSIFFLSFFAKLSRFCAILFLARILDDPEGYPNFTHFHENKFESFRHESLVPNALTANFTLSEEKAEFERSRGEKERKLEKRESEKWEKLTLGWSSERRSALGGEEI
jgi:hypothetical protein